MDDLPVLRLANPHAAVVEPISTGAGGGRYHVVTTPGLTRPVLDQLRTVRLRRHADGGATVVVAAEDGPALLVGHWRCEGDVTVVSAAKQAPGGSWRTFDGYVASGELHAVVVDGFTATVAHLTADVLAEPADEPLPHAAVPGDGLPNAHPSSALDVDFPLYDLALFPGPSFAGARPHRAVLHLVPSVQGLSDEVRHLQLPARGFTDRRFALSLISTEGPLPGSLHLSLDGLRPDEHVRGARIVVRWPTSEEPPRWLDSGRPLDLTTFELTVDFDPATHRVTGAIRGRRITGEEAEATFTGLLRAREVQQLRETIALPDCSGRWIDALAAHGTVHDVRCAPQPEPHMVDLPPGRLRYVPALELLTGLGGLTTEPELVVLAREAPVRRDLPDDPTARQALRFLGQDLTLAGRVAEARPVLDHAARLIERATAGPSAAESEAISLVLLLNWQVRCAFLLRDYAGLLGHLQRAVELRHELADEGHARARTALITPTLRQASSLLDGVAGIARALSDGAARARHPVEAPAAAVVRELENGSAAVAAIEHAAPPGAMLSEVVAALERAMEATSSALTDASARCLADPAGVAADLTDLIAERARIVGVVDGGAGLRPSDLATWEEREQHLEHLARARLPAPDAELFVLRKDAATALRTAANLLALSRSFLRRADPVTSLDQRRTENRAAAGRLGEYIERWRRRIAEDGQRIVASEQAGPFYDRLVGMLLDLGGPDEAWVAAELAKARATADLLGIGPDEELSLDALRAAVATLDRTVVEYVVRRDELVVWVVRPEGPVRCVRHPVPDDRLAATATRVHELTGLRRPRPADATELTATLRELGTELWDPVAELVDPLQRITVVPHRELSLVPFGSLGTADGRPLLEHHTLTVLPAVSLVPALTGRGTTGEFRGPLLALVDPEPMPFEGLGQLTRTRHAFPAVADLFPTEGRAVWTGRDATVDRLTAPDLPPAVVVLATHASATDTEVFVALAPTAGHDGRVTPSELVGMGLPGSTVVLSACDTGSGRITNDGVDGLSRAFLVGGASTLIMTLHEVVEDVALELVYRFLDHWRTGGPVDVAFRAAQLDLAAECTDDPGLWIPFALFGLGG